jgi:hypothetical protein
MNKLIAYFTDGKQAKRKGGLYHKTRVNLAYNSSTSSFIIAACVSLPQFAVIYSTLAFQHRILSVSGLNIFIRIKYSNT